MCDAFSHPETEVSSSCVPGGRAAVSFCSGLEVRVGAVGVDTRRTTTPGQQPEAELSPLQGNGIVPTGRTTVLVGLDVSQASYF